MELANWPISRIFTNISWKILMNGEEYSIALVLKNNNSPLLTITNLTFSKRSFSLSPSDQIKSFQLFKTMSVPLWARNLLWLPHLISPNATEIRRLWVLSSLYCQPVLILLLISWSFRCKWAWESVIDQFLWARVKERRPKHWYNYHALRDIGCFFKIVTCLSVGCPNCNSSWKV